MIEDIKERRLLERSRRQLGLITLRDARELGISSASLRHRVTKGRLRQIRRGVYTNPAARPTLDQQLLAGCLSVGPDAVLSHFSAVSKWGLAPFEMPIQVSTNTHGGNQQGLTVYPRMKLQPGDRTKIGVIPITTVARTLFDVARSLSIGELGALADDALRRRIVTVARLRRTLEARGAMGRQGTTQFRQVVNARDPEYVATESRLEDKIERALIAAGLPPPVRQFQLFLEGEFVARLDLAYPELRLAIEVDGYAHHFGEGSFHHDRGRWNRISAAGWTVLFATASRPGLTDLIEQLSAMVRPRLSPS